MTPLDIHIRDEIDLDLEQELGRKYAVITTDYIDISTEDGFSICAEVLDYTYETPAEDLAIEGVEHHTERYSYLKEDIPLPVGTTIEITDWI